MQDLEPPPQEEVKPAVSLAETIELQGGLTLMEVSELFELGINNLPSIEEGGLSHGSSEVKNKAYRINYLQEHLGIEASKVPHPNPTEKKKFLPERLVADVLVDTIGLCRTIRVLLDEKGRLMAMDRNEQVDSEIEKLNTSIEHQLAMHRDEMRLRRSKGEALDHSFALKGEVTNSKNVGQENGFFPARSLNPLREAYLKNIFQTLETALAAKQPPPAQ